MAGVPVLNEDLVNLPNWLLLEFRIEGEEALDMSNVEVLHYRHEYDARYAVLGRVTRFRDRAGRETTLETRRFVSMSDVHRAARSALQGRSSVSVDTGARRARGGDQAHPRRPGARSLRRSGPDRVRGPGGRCRGHGALVPRGGGDRS